MRCSLIRSWTLVAPFTGAWIEILSAGMYSAGTASLPSRERGLKCSRRYYWGWSGTVAPFTGAWIEINHSLKVWADGLVAPFTGAWIEIQPQWRYAHGQQSLPSRERGLKFAVSVGLAGS